jgi:hypothetical protein
VMVIDIGSVKKNNVIWVAKREHFGNSVFE